MIALAFYKAEGTRFDRLIRWRTGSQYSHVEIVIGNLCYSSSNRDGGVRLKEIDLRPDRWDILPFDANPAEIVRLYARTQGQRYDWVGVAGQAVGLPFIQYPGRWYCSEWVAQALGLKTPWKHTPQSIFDAVK